MPITRPLSSLARATASGVLGVAAVEGGRRVVRRGGLRAGAVAATTWSLRGWRRVEAGAEAARLGGADILAEARERAGEQAPVPADGAAHQHDH